MITATSGSLLTGIPTGASPLGNNDKSGSLWLTAFVLKSFAQAKDLIYIDDSVLSDA